MAKTLYGYRLGADVKEKDAPTGVKLVPDNKTLMALPLNDDHDDDDDRYCDCDEDAEDAGENGYGDSDDTCADAI